MADTELWVFVDDKPIEADSFAQALSKPDDSFTVLPRSPEDTREQILRGKLVPNGILMDVDFSAIPGELGTGLGLAQDIRAKQKSEDIQDFAIVRLAGAIPVNKNIGGDPTSDDLFDLKIDKSEVNRSVPEVRQRLRGVYEVYSSIRRETELDTPAAISRILNLPVARLEEWSHPTFHRRLADNRVQAVHVAAGTFMRAFLEPAGLLINEDLLSFRLGIDHVKSAASWDALRDKHLDCIRYTGAGHGQFPRWWARGLDDWWLERIRDETPLAARTIEERHSTLLQKISLKDLIPLAMSRTSPGDRPWRLCMLHLENDPTSFVPVDPICAVRMSPRTDTPPWVDPAYVELGAALRNKKDRRLNHSDMDNLEHRFR